MKLKRILTLVAIVVIGLVLYFIGYEYYDRLKFSPDYPGRAAAEGAVDGGLAAMAEVPLDVMQRMRRLCEKFGDYDTTRMEVAVDTLNGIEVENPGEYHELFDRLEALMAVSNGNPGLTDRPIETGDALIDRVMAELYEVSSHQQISNLMKTSYAVIQRRTLDEWEEEFAGDLRFWELRFIQEKIYTEHDNARALGSLQEARDRGLATADTLLTMFLVEYNRVTGDAEAAGDEPGARLRAASGDLQALLDEAAAMDPDHAWPHYLRAMLLYQTGDPDKALDCIAAGNRSKNLEFPRLRLLREVEAGLTAERPVGCAITSGIFQEYQIALTLFHAETFKVFEQECLDQAADSGRLEDIQPWHELGCRFAAAWPTNALLTLQGLSLVRRAVDHVSDPEQWTISDVQRLTLDHTLGAVATAVRPLTSGAGNRLGIDEMELMIAAGGATGFRVVMYLDGEISARLIEETTVPVIDDLLLVSYPDLTLRDRLQDYPILEPENLQAFYRGEYVAAGAD